MPRRSTRAKTRKATRNKRVKPSRAKHRKPVRTTHKYVAQGVDLIWKEKVSPQINHDLQTLDKNLETLEEATKQVESLIGWADRHSKKFEEYALSAISALNAQAAYEASVLKILLLRLGSIMVDVELLKTRKTQGAQQIPPELEASLGKLQETINRFSEANKASIEAAKRLIMYF